jgi:hypothetical protein
MPEAHGIPDFEQSRRGWRFLHAVHETQGLFVLYCVVLNPVNLTGFLPR